ncbi:MAG: DMT family transporter [bacterium]
MKNGLPAGEERPLPGFALLFLAAFVFSLMIALVKAASASVPVGQLLFFRFFIGLAAIQAARSAGVIKFTPVNRAGLFLRGLFGGIAVLCYFVAVYRGGDVHAVTHAVLLNSTYPIFVAMFSAVYIGERVRRGMILPLAAAGLALVLKPASGGVLAADLIGLASGVSAGFAILTVRKLRRTDSVWCILYYFNLIGALFAVPVIIITRSESLSMPSAGGVLLILGAAALANTAQALLTAAYRFTRASEGSVTTLASVVFSSIIAALFFGERLTALTVVGGLLILGAGVALSARSKAEAPSS